MMNLRICYECLSKKLFSVLYAFKKKKKIWSFSHQLWRDIRRLSLQRFPSTSLLMFWFVSCGCLKVWIHRLQALAFYLLFGSLSYVIKKNLYGLYQFHLMYLFMGLLHNKQETCEVVNSLFLCPFIWGKVQNMKK
jgi:hypothetical protein